MVGFHTEIEIIGRADEMGEQPEDTEVEPADTQILDSEVEPVERSVDEHTVHSVERIIGHYIESG